MPTDGTFEYTFSNVARVISRFTEIIGLTRFAIYVFDYGAPVGLRIALEHPERITAIISQNGNAYEEGLSAGWDSLREYWAASNGCIPRIATFLLHAGSNALSIYRGREGQVVGITRR
jgi:pimeloyl-ACP methyl ester carboxylesterase